MPDLADRRAATLQQLLREPRIWRGDTQAPIAAEATGLPALDRVLPGGGWPAAALSELLLPEAGIGEIGLVLPWLARLTQAGGRAALVAPPHVPYAPALAQAGVVLPRLIWLRPGSVEGALWSAEQLLRSGVFGTVLLWPGSVREQSLRRLQLAAESGAAIGILFREEAAAREPSPAALRLQLSRRAGALELRVLKCRAGRAGQQLVARAAGWA